MQRKERQARIFEEKKRAYSNVLEAIHNVAVLRSRENLTFYGLKQAELTLVGSPEIVRISDELRNIKEENARHEALERLYIAMRKDLGIDTRKLKE